MSYVVDQDTAEQDFERLCKARHLELDTEAMSKDQRRAFEACKGQVVRGIMLGRLQVDEAGEAVYTPITPGTEPIGIGTPTGSMWTAGDGLEGATRQLSMFGQVTGTPLAVMRKLYKPDTEFCVALLQVFLA